MLDINSKLKNKDKAREKGAIRHRISRKYFLVCFLSVFVSLLVIGIVVLVVVTRFFEQDKFDAMLRNATVAANVTSNNYTLNDYNGIDKPTIATSYRIIGESTNSDYLLVSLEGDLIYFSNEETGADYSKIVLSDEIQRRAINGNYANTGILKGIANAPSYVVGVPVLIQEEPVAVLYAITSAEDLVAFLTGIIQTLLIVSTVVLLAAFLLISYVTSRMLKPISYMVEATHSFSQGDFTKRIPVSSYDEIGQLSMSFNNMASALADMETSRRSFLANVSHELKTPMTTIGGFVDGILDGTIPLERQGQYLQIVSMEVKRLSRLVHSMLNTARIEAGEMEIRPSVFDISELVRQTVFTFESKIEEKELDMRGLEIDRIMVNADEDLMHQVVYNLVENAVKFVDFKGYISVSYQVEKDMTYVSITNSGQGLSREDANRIFERFYKSDRSRTDSSSTGVGLGLHIVKSILKYHKGTIEAVSEEGKFTEFRFGIPSAKDKA